MILLFFFAFMWPLAVGIGFGHIWQSYVVVMVGKLVRKPARMAFANVSSGGQKKGGVKESHSFRDRGCIDHGVE